MENDGQQTPHGPQTFAITATQEDAGTRLDRFLAAGISELSRARLQALIRTGFVNGPAGTIGDIGHRVKPGELFEVRVPAPTEPDPKGQQIPLNIIYEDKYLIVIDKPAGLVVHPGAGHSDGTLVNALLAHCGDSLSGIGGVRRPGIVHRLDKETSGLLVIAKSDAAHQGLAEQFASHGEDGRLQRSYLALAWGAPPRRVGVIEARIGRSSGNRTRMAVVRGEHGRHATTHFELLESFTSGTGEPLASLLRLQLETGRTHQIRVHLAHIGHPVMGDPVYAAGFRASHAKLAEPARVALETLARQALHATALGFEHPVTLRPLYFESPLPPDIAALETALRPSPVETIKSLKEKRKTKMNPNLTET